MVACSSADLEQLTCWPLQLLSEHSSGGVKGFVMRNADKHKELHKLYNPKSRLAEFDNADWRFLINTGANIARAFAVVHKNGHVIGDVNHSSVMVAGDTTVRLIDCDSFQISLQGQTFECVVAEPLHTPPELQGKGLEGKLRTPNHDNFGLAVLIFELMAMGRHPFAGAALVPGEVAIERKIASHMFAYGPGATARQMKQPPHTISLDAMSPKIASMFEGAFLEAGRTIRPTALEWASALSDLLLNLRQCSYIESHYYHDNSASCPWCAIEQSVGISLFGVGLGIRASRSAFDLTKVWATIVRVAPPSPPPFPTYSPLPVAMPASTYRTIGNRRRGFAASGVIVGLLVASSVFIDPSFICPGLFFAWLAWLLISQQGAAGLVVAKADAEASFRSAKAEFDSLRSRWQSTASLDVFEATLADLNKKKRDYEDIDARRQREFDALEAALHERQLTRFLETFRILPGVITGIGYERCGTLGYYGIETAADITSQSVLNVPGFGVFLTDKLLDWKRSVLSKFAFDPSAGTDPRDLQKLDADIEALRGGLVRDLLSGADRLRQISSSIESSASALLPAAHDAVRRLAQADADMRCL